MKKVFMKKQIFLKEDVNISDPTFAQQYLAVKKQISDKQIKKDQLMKSVNQVDNEINILNRNLIAIETKSSTKPQTTTNKNTTEKDNKTQQNTQTTQNTQNTKQPISNSMSNECLNYDAENQINESVYDDMIDDIEKELSKLSDIKSYIENYDSKDKQKKDETKKNIGIWEIPPINSENDINIPDIDDNIKDNDIENADISDEITDIENLDNTDLNNISDEITDLNKQTNNPFIPSDEQQIVDEILKVEEDKAPFIPKLVEQEDIETELELLNYEDDDQPKDEYVFNVRINAEYDSEIIAKIYKENEDDDWEIRVVKGDELPLQDMKFDNRLDKLDIIGYLADFYEEIEIMDPEEYQYLLDDKEKIDKEYYEIKEPKNMISNWKNKQHKYITTEEET